MEKKIFDWVNENLGNEIWEHLPENSTNYIGVDFSTKDKNIILGDPYKMYEKHYYKYQIDVCDAILMLRPNEKEIIEWKENYISVLKKIELEAPIPKRDFNELTTSINNAFFRLESFMNGTIKEYQSFNFDETFTILFNETKKPENFTYDNCKLIGKYWTLTEQIRVDYDKSEFDNTNAYENEDFCNDCEEIMYLNYERIDEFCQFSTPDELEEYEKKASITDIINSQPIKHTQPVTKQIYRQDSNQSLYDFFDKVRECSISDLEIYNTIEKLTDNFNKSKLKLLLEDFEFYCHVEKEEKEAEYTKEDIDKAIKEYEKKGKELPYFAIPDIFKDKNGKTIIKDNAIKVLDKEKLLFPYYFFGFYHFKSLITKWGEEQLKLQTLKTPVKSDTFIKAAITFSPEEIPDIFKLLKKYFNPDQHTLLEKTITTGEDATEPLIFISNGNRLADTFKKLYKNDSITGCSQLELESWILKNFKYRYRGQIKSFTAHYLNDIISSNKLFCKNPLM